MSASCPLSPKSRSRPKNRRRSSRASQRHRPFPTTPPRPSPIRTRTTRTADPPSVSSRRSPTLAAEPPPRFLFGNDARRVPQAELLHHAQPVGEIPRLDDLAVAEGDELHLV